MKENFRTIYFWNIWLVLIALFLAVPSMRFENFWDWIKNICLMLLLIGAGAFSMVSISKIKRKLDE